MVDTLLKKITFRKTLLIKFERDEEIPTCIQDDGARVENE